MRAIEERELARGLVKRGMPAAEVGRQLSIPQSTVRYWARPTNGPTGSGRPILRVEGVPAGAYAYLLGAYLGDGFLARAKGSGVRHLRIYCDERYPKVSDEIAAAMSAVNPLNRVNVQHHPVHRLAIVCSYSAQWPLLFLKRGRGESTSD